MQTVEKVDVVVLGAGVVGTTTAYWLARRGLDVVTVDRQPKAGMETSFANGGQVSVSHAEPWANPSAPLKVLKWLMNPAAPLLFSPQLDPQQWRWIAGFFRECLPSRSAYNTKAIIDLATFSRDKLQQIRRETGIDYDQKTKGILHFYRDRKEYENAIPVAALMRDVGCDRNVLTRDEVLDLEPTLRAQGQDIVGGTYTAEDENGDAHKFTVNLAAITERLGGRFLYEYGIDGLETDGTRITGVVVTDQQTGRKRRIIAEEVVVCMGSYSAPFLRRYGIDLPIYPAKGYSITLPVTNPSAAPEVSLTDDQYKLVYSRLGDRLRVAGTAELAGYSTDIRPIRWQSIRDNVKGLFPEAGDYDQVEYWAGLRPTTPSNLPHIERRKYANLILNTGHGTLGWTMSCGSGWRVADMIRPEAADDWAPLMAAE